MEKSVSERRATFLPRRAALPIAAIILIGAQAAASPARAQPKVLILKNGLEVGPVSLAENWQSDPIVQTLDELRITSFPRRQIANVIDVPSKPIVIPTANKIRVAKTGVVVGGAGAPIQQSYFDVYGRRTYSLMSADGRVDVVQGITEISPYHVKVEGLQNEKPHQWDMRLALSAIPADHLKAILLKNANLDKPQDWLNIVSLYEQAERFKDAREVLEKAMKYHPQLQNQAAQLVALDQRLADQMFMEVEIRQRAGQHKMAADLLAGFTSQQITEETKLKVAKKLSDQQQDQQRQQQIQERLKSLVNALADPSLKQSLQGFMEEVAQHLSIQTVGRLVDFDRLKDDEGLPVEQRVAIAVGGWIFGSDMGQGNLPVVMSALQTRDLVQKYLASQNPTERAELLKRMANEEAGTPNLVSAMLSRLLPPLPLPSPVPNIPHRYRVDVTLGGPLQGQRTSYWVQLPPEYNPYRRYPCVLALRGQYLSATRELEWWTGPYNEQWGICMGEASRHGYIVVAPEWWQDNQLRYDSTADEHARVLSCLRDAMRRVSIDSDRVFISGHHFGATAAWDIALAHPDLWAGLVSIGGHVRENGGGCEYIKHYHPSAHYLPMYFVFGAMDGVPAPIERDGETLNRYFETSKCESLVVMFIGRGADHFQEEIFRIFRWMNLADHVRRPSPTELKVTVARPSDNFFWWLEVQQFRDRVMNHPLMDFDPKRTIDIDADVNKTANSFRLRTLAADSYSIWLSPQNCDFNKKLVVLDGNKRKTFDVAPDLTTLMEDARQRADYQRPHWARVEIK